jgi:hypothetical protein
MPWSITEISLQELLVASVLKIDKTDNFMQILELIEIMHDALPMPAQAS